VHFFRKIDIDLYATVTEVTPHVENNVCLTDAKKTQKI